MSTFKEIDGSRPYCLQHNLLTCKVCLHSVKTTKDGRMPKNTAEFSCDESAHSVKPRFELARKGLSDLGYPDGLSPEERSKSAYPEILKSINDGRPYYDCAACGLTWLAGGGPEYFAAHPSHVGSDGQRYLIAVVRPTKFMRVLEQIECHAYFNFGHASPMNVSYKCVAKSDLGTADWNLDNAELAALTRMLHHVADKVFPYRKKLVHDYIYTNSAHFAGQAQRFQLLVVTSLNQDLLRFLGKVQDLKYNAKKKAYVEKNMLGITVKKYRVTEERRFQISNFFRIIKNLAADGIQVHWWPAKVEASACARKAFMDQPSTLPPPPLNESQIKPPFASEAVDSGDEMTDDELVDADSFEETRDQEEYQDVECVLDPEEDAEIQKAIWASLSNY
ncbi:hypothetical protein F5Y00DRAFT_272521 [Daldinia vernicosa]|uniref:uncharacterized protein n=1 Tax=Daldinia vernicosa TaxID=114800 RepID=UPI0020088DD7|nr:uncharacterized protein F5Y00DRAFT_272521 [Daldinia vernicosa]KAI0852946.1 hypothetical protein F5Y00DRAFT_272521 [Daldinia vernicosa]